MRRVLAFVETNHVALIAAGLIDEISRLVHVVPNSSHAMIRIRAMEIAPPSPRLWQRVIDKDTFARPYPADEQLAVLAFLKVVLFDSLVVNVVTLVVQTKFRGR